MAPTDLRAVMAIQAQCYQGGLPESQGSLAAKLGASPGTCFIASSSVGEAPLGYLFALPWLAGGPPPHDAAQCELPARPDCLYLHDLAVSPPGRKLGVGKAMVGAFFEALARMALPSAGLVAVQGSSTYWARHGFQPATVSADLALKLRSYGDDAIYMVRHSAA